MGDRWEFISIGILGIFGIPPLSVQKEGSCPNPSLLLNILQWRIQDFPDPEAGANNLAIFFAKICMKMKEIRPRDVCRSFFDLFCLFFYVFRFRSCFYSV